MWSSLVNWSSSTDEDLSKPGRFADLKPELWPVIMSDHVKGPTDTALNFIGPYGLIYRIYSTA